MELTQQIKDYLVSHPVNRKSADPYGEAAKHFDTSRERIRTIYRRLRASGLVESALTYSQQLTNEFVKEKFPIENSTTFTSDTLNISKDIETPVKTIEELLQVCEVDGKLWDVQKAECKKRDVLSGKDEKGQNQYKSVYSINVALKRKSIDSSKDLQLDILKKELGKSSISSVNNFLAAKAPQDVKKEYLFEISIPDVHFGKLSHREEVGEDYDIKIATERYNTAIQELLKSVNLFSIEKILFPIGNDMVNVDSTRNETWAGTRQDVDSRFYKIVRTVKSVLIENIDKLSVIAPVDVLVIPGNHDLETMFMIGEMLDAYYHNSDRVKVDNSPTRRKYYQYGKNGFQYTHGNEERHGELGLIFATEKPQLWAATEFRYAKLGHQHRQKKTNYVSVDEHTGFTIQILPSLSGSDAWHNSKGYMSKKAAKGFLYHPEKGLIAELNHNL